MRMGFGEWKKVHADLWEGDITGYRINRGLPMVTNEPFAWRNQMITFTQITEIESIRRQIETLQQTLSDHSNITTFGWIGANDKWRALGADVAPYVKEVVCKVTSAKIVKLLDEAARLGVDTDNEKKLLLYFLQELAPKDPNP